MNKKEAARRCCELAAMGLGTNYEHEKQTRNSVLCRKIAANVVLRLWPLTTMKELAECLDFSRPNAVKILRTHASDFEEQIINGYIANVYAIIKEEL